MVEHMTVIEQDIRSIPAILRLTHARVAACRDTVAPLLHGPLAIIGCGSSYCVAMAAASLYEHERQTAARAIHASDSVPHADWTHVAISRTGQTTEVVEALRRARAAGARCLLLTGEPDSPAAAHADTVLLLEFAAEQGVIQTRFIAAAIEALRLLIGGVVTSAALEHLPERVESGLATLEATPLLGYDHMVFLGRGWRYGLARAAALNLQETALLVPEGHQTLDYRHGPMAGADAGTLVWCLDPLDDAASGAVLDDVRQTGALVRWTGDDPLVALAQAQLLALRKAAARGIDPAAPRHLSRAVILTSTQA